MKKITKDYVREYFKEFPPENIEKDTLLKLANEIKRKKDLTVKPSTIMIAIAQVLKEDYDSSWGDVERQLMDKIGKKIYLNWLISSTIEGKIYFKIDTDEKEGDKKKIDFYLYNPCVTKIIDTYHEKSIPSLMNSICSYSNIFLNYVVKGHIDGDIPYWYEIDVNIYNILKENPELAFELLDTVKNLIIDLLDISYRKSFDEIRDIIKSGCSFAAIEKLKDLYLKLWGEKESFPLNDILLQKFYACLLYRCGNINKKELDIIEGELEQEDKENRGV